MQQITRGDYLEDLITIYIENNLQQGLDDLYDMFVFQCGEIQKQLTPAPVIKISFTEAESKLLTNYNTCYLAGITKDGHKETFNGSISFNTRGEVVYYEPTPNSSLQASTTSTIACPCTGISGVFANCTQPAIKAYFSINYVPTKLSELQNDTDFQDSVDVANSIAEHNASESAHPYIQSVMASTTEALSVSIQAETTARIEAVSAAISTTEAYTDSVVTQATEATKAYADSIVSTATTATEAYTDSLVQSATTAINTTIGDLSQLDTSVKSSVVNAINSEVSARQGADNNLQNQIDGLAAASDVTDIVGTYAELQAYDTQHLNNNDIIKVLSDETHDDEPSYYRFNKTAGTFSYIGSESAAYTKAQADAKFVTQTTTINGEALSQNITLTATEVGALPSTTTINDLTTTAQQNALNSGVTSAVVSQVGTNTTNIASNTSAISTINGKIPTDASSTNKLVSASALAASIANFANQDLSNLTSNGEGRLHALKSYSDEGELLTDSEGLAFIKNYAHSTFDLSKFTVVGSPIVTTDGVATYFPYNGYLTKTISISKDSNFTIYGQFDYETLSTGQTLIGFVLTSSDRISLTTYNNKLNFAGSGVIGDTSLVGGNSYYYKANWTGSEWKIYLLINNEWHLEITDDTNYSGGHVLVDSDIATVIIGANLNYVSESNNRRWQGTQDLKEFSITVDGVEVFSGNKTGIDTIKPNNFTAITSSASSPFINPSLPFSDSGLTISADGVVSGFSSSNYLNINNSGNGGNDVELYVKFKTETITTAGFIISTRLGYYSNKRFYSRVSRTDYYSDVFAEDNTEYLAHVYLKNQRYICEVSKDNGSTWLRVCDVEYSGNIDTSGYSLGCGGAFAFSGSIDLNSFKIYVDGDLVYQPCLKIPYTESKTGSKIVNSIYRDRVNDMAEQFGYANYYTLSDTDFTLPQVELYGLIGQRTLRDSYRNGINYWELYSNRDLEQGGSCTSGVEVTFARPFADTNYVLSVPYSAKSSTAFTPTQTGDWIAKGKGLL